MDVMLVDTSKVFLTTGKSIFILLIYWTIGQMAVENQRDCQTIAYYFVV